MMGTEDDIHSMKQDEYRNCGPLGTYLKIVSRALQCRVSEEIGTAIANRYYNMLSAEEYLISFLESDRDDSEVDDIEISEECRDSIFCTKSVIDSIELNKEEEQRTVVQCGAIVENLFDQIPGATAPFESIFVFNTFICSDGNGYGIYCRSCLQKCDHNEYKSLHEALRSIHVVAPLHAMTRLNPEESRNTRSFWLSDINQSSCMYHLSADDTQSQFPEIRKCQPPQLSSTCIGQDHLILSSIQSEINAKFMEDNKSNVAWKSLINILKKAKPIKQISLLQDILDGVSSKTALCENTRHPIIRLVENDSEGNYFDDNESFDNEIVKKCVSVHTLHIHRDSFPRMIPDTWLPNSPDLREELNRKKCENEKERVLPLHCWIPILEIIKDAPQTCPFAKFYRSIPLIVLDALYYNADGEDCLYYLESRMSKEILEKYVFYLKKDPFIEKSSDGQTVYYIPSVELISLACGIKETCGNFFKDCKKDARDSPSGVSSKAISNVAKKAINTALNGRTLDFDAVDFELESLFPYRSLVTGRNENDHEVLGFSVTQHVLDSTYFKGTFPYSTSLERMTNPCFQKTVGKDGDKFENNSMLYLHRQRQLKWPRSKRVREEGLYDNDYVDRVTTRPPTSGPERKSKTSSTQPPTSGSTFIVNGSCDTLVRKGPQLNHSVVLDRWNCISANIANTLEVLGLKSALSKIKEITDFKTVKAELRRLGMSVFNLPRNMSLDSLQRAAEYIQMPMITSLTIPYNVQTNYSHVVGIVPTCTTSVEKAECIIVDGALCDRFPVVLNQASLTHICGGNEHSVAHETFAFLPGVKCSKEELKCAKEDSFGFIACLNISNPNPRTCESELKRIQLLGERIKKVNIVLMEEREYVHRVTIFREQYDKGGVNTLPSFV